ncbi:hypothetical protein HRbin35_00274 [bacterium HR35]|nr:hypothetical protein HRbin35_00274 [bacterium HR35]
MKGFLYLPLLFLAFIIDVIEIILSLADSTVILIVLHILQILLDLLFNLLFLVIFLPSIFEALREKRAKTVLIRRIVAFLTEAIGESIPVLDFLPIRSLTIFFMWLDESGIIEKIQKKISETISKASQLPVIGTLVKKYSEVLEQPLVKEVLPRVVSNKAIETLSPISSLPQTPQVIQPKKIETSPKTPYLKSAKLSTRGTVFVFLFFFSLFSFSSISLAQTKEVYFFTKKTKDGIIVSSIFVNPKTKTIYEPPPVSKFDWKIPFSQDFSITSYKSFLKVDPDPKFKRESAKIKLFVSGISFKDKKFYEGEVFLPSPDISIIKIKNSYFELPFLGKIEGNEILSYKTWNFTSDNLTNVWKLNDIFLSNQRQLNINLISPGLLSLEVVNLNNRNEKVIKFLLVK